jgi:hypothetical protein
MKHIKKFKDVKKDLLKKLEEFDQLKWVSYFNRDPLFIEIGKEHFMNKNKDTRFGNIYPKRLEFMRTIDCYSVGYNCSFDEEGWHYYGTVEIEEVVNIYIDKTV